MGKNIIPFAHQFTKLHGQTSATLLAVELTTLEQEYEEMVDLDTEYYEGSEQKNYPLKPGCMYVLLTLQGNKKIPFTTLRKAKGNYYNSMKSKIGQIFELPQLQRKSE